MRAPPLNMKMLLESNPPKPRSLVWRLAATHPRRGRSRRMIRQRDCDYAIGDWPQPTRGGGGAAEAGKAEAEAQGRGALE